MGEMQWKWLFYKLPERTHSSEDLSQHFPASLLPQL